MKNHSHTILPKLRRKKFLIGDNLSSHLSYNTVKLCIEHVIHFIFLLANSTHISQPFDVSFFHLLKVTWRRILTAWKQTVGLLQSTVPKSSLMRLLKKLHDEIFTNCESNVRARHWEIFQRMNLLFYGIHSIQNAERKLWRKNAALLDMWTVFANRMQVKFLRPYKGSWKYCKGASYTYSSEGENKLILGK